MFKFKKVGFYHLFSIDMGEPRRDPVKGLKFDFVLKNEVGRTPEIDEAIAELCKLFLDRIEKDAGVNLGHINDEVEQRDLRLGKEGNELFHLLTIIAEPIYVDNSTNVISFDFDIDSVVKSDAIDRKIKELCDLYVVDLHQRVDKARVMKKAN